ncbi:hypothetical protein Q6A51_14740 [Pseudomonas sp. KFB-139]|uniref:Uncharacterized protein n=1 Tax=Pseudomonas serbiensis TaxID=3064350 RepID=A0ABT9CRC0_9PSED|nr:hypothetical protein [Pseudomonas sp. KFB-138]MDO7928050.1 hypothetical protein [Pseudomonas sp. KFB-138]
MDKILLTAFLTALAGFITAALSVVKLVNEKESKTTEFRQSWTESARAALSDLIAKLNFHVTNIVHVKDLKSEMTKAILIASKTKNPVERDLLGEVINLYKDLLGKSVERSRQSMREVYQAHATVRLHFKPEDSDLVRIENKFDYCMGKFSELGREEESEKWDVLKEQVYNATNEITASSRALLKTEWEKVKQGEPAYKSTKKWSVWAFAIMSALLVVIGVHSLISYS